MQESAQDDLDEGVGRRLGRGLHHLGHRGPRELAAETAEREVFRKDLIKLVGTNLSSSLFPGELADTGNIAKKVDKVSEAGVERANNTITGARGVPVNLYLTPEDRTRLAPFLSGLDKGYRTVVRFGIGTDTHDAAGEPGPRRAVDFGADALAAERGMVYVHPFDDVHVIAGQGTVADEILR